MENKGFKLRIGFCGGTSKVNLAERLKLRKSFKKLCLVRFTISVTSAIICKIFTAPSRSILQRVNGDSSALIAMLQCSRSFPSRDLSCLPSCCVPSCSSMRSALFQVTAHRLHATTAMQSRPRRLASDVCGHRQILPFGRILALGISIISIRILFREKEGNLV